MGSKRSLVVVGLVALAVAMAFAWWPRTGTVPAVVLAPAGMPRPQAGPAVAAPRPTVLRPAVGGQYAYLRDAFGPLPAFLYGWASFLVIASGSIAALAVAFANYLAPLLPFAVPRPLISVVTIAIVAVINVRGTRGSATVQNWTTGAKACITCASWWTT